jgi:Family of unknown function (DUF5320)
MPRGDRTGPAGTGPRQGRGAGYCGGFDMPGYASRGLGRGRGRGFGPADAGGGRGFGRRWRWFGLGGALDTFPWGEDGPAFDAERERQALRSHADALRARLRAIESRLAESDEGDEKPE